MFKKISILTIVLAISILAANVAFALPMTDKESDSVKNPVTAQDTVIKIKSVDKISTKVNKQGDKVHFTVTEDLLSGNQTIIPKNSDVIGTITKLNRAGAWDYSGNIVVTFSEITAKDGHTIPVEGTLQVSGKKPNIFVRYALMGVFVKGKQTAIEPGTEASLKIKEDNISI